MTRHARRTATLKGMDDRHGGDRNASASATMLAGADVRSVAFHGSSTHWVTRLICSAAGAAASLPLATPPGSPAEAPGGPAGTGPPPPTRAAPAATQERTG